VDVDAEAGAERDGAVYHDDQQRGPHGDGHLAQSVTERYVPVRTMWRLTRQTRAPEFRVDPVLAGFLPQSLPSGETVNLTPSRRRQRGLIRKHAYSLILRQASLPRTIQRQVTTPERRLLLPRR
jgi:hypothetical protein